MESKKIVLIGAGSYCFGVGQLRDILVSKRLNGLGFELALVDLNEKTLDVVTRLAVRIKEEVNSDIKITRTTDRCEALKGASYVITAVARKRWELWEQDYRIPRSYGFESCLGENGGPGALFHALRSFNLMIPICRDMERLCPNAMLLNFTNPEARVLHAILSLTKIKAVGICHGIFSAVRMICRELDQELEQLEITSGGMNHFYSVLSIKDKKTNKELLPELLEKIKTDKSIEMPPLARKLAEIFDVISYQSDDHIGEYLSFGSESMSGLWKYGQELKKVELITPAPEESEIELLAAGKLPISEGVLQPSTEATVPIICDIEHDGGGRYLAVNVLNTHGYIENLPRTAVVEVPAVADANGVHPIHVGSMPEPFAAYVRTQQAIQELITEAYRTGEKRPLLQALLLDPVVNNISNAEKMLDEMLELQSCFLPKFV
jgi:alpha-galactosidase/6-phospho-beta-glucosidase family protein